MMIRIARYFGVGLQGIILGTLLFFAILMLLGVAADARIFQYQGY